MTDKRATATFRGDDSERIQKLKNHFGMKSTIELVRFALTNLEWKVEESKQRISHAN